MPQKQPPASTAVSSCLVLGTGMSVAGAGISPAASARNVTRQATTAHRQIKPVRVENLMMESLCLDSAYQRVDSPPRARGLWRHKIVRTRMMNLQRRRRGFSLIELLI